MLIKSQTKLDCFIVNNFPCNDEASDLSLQAQRFLLGVAIHSLAPLQGLDGKYISYPGLRRKSVPEPGLGLRLADLSVCRIKSILNSIVIMNKTVILSVSEGSRDIHEKIFPWVQNDKAAPLGLLRYARNDGASDLSLRVQRFLLGVAIHKLAALLGLLRYARNDEASDFLLCFWLSRPIGLQARSAQPRLRRRFLASQAWVKTSKSSERCKRESFLTR